MSMPSAAPRLNWAPTPGRAPLPTLHLVRSLYCTSLDSQPLVVSQTLAGLLESAQSFSFPGNHLFGVHHKVGCATVESPPLESPPW